MDELYEEALAYFKTERTLFKGFLIEKVNGSVRILDIRDPYYYPAKPEDLQVILSMGFRVGTTYLLMKSDEGKIEKFTALADGQRVKLKTVKNARKKQEYENSIIRYTNEIIYYESQVRRWQFFLKNN